YITRLIVWQWSSPAMSLVGRGNSVEMIILPKLLYLFQTLPICFTGSLFQQLDCLMSSSIWQGKQLPGETMELVVFTSTAQRGGEHDFGAFSKEKFSATKTEAERGTFTVKKVQPEDKGLYFCAVSQHSDTNP
uniref:Ig-like domain-containing protein n=1 Tax=Oryzias latipes TaxID=8090 RepID=A0A3B3ILN0_ORYLA